MELLKIWTILIRRRWVIVLAFLTFVMAVLAFTLLITPTYKAKAKILVESSSSISSLLNILEMQAPSSTTTEYDTEIGLALSKPLVGKLISELHVKDRFGRDMREDKLVKSSFLNFLWPQPAISVEQYEESTILEISATSADSRQAADIVNLLANLYIEKRKDITRQEYHISKVFVEEQIGDLRQNYYHYLEQMRDFMVTDGVLDLDLEAQQLISKISGLITSYDDNENDVALYKQEIKESSRLLGEVREFRREYKEFSQNQTFTDLKSKLQAALVDLAVKKIDFQPSHPEYQQVENKVEELEGLIRHELVLVLNRERFSIDPIHDNLALKSIESKINLELALLKRTLFKELIDEYQQQLLTFPLKKIKDSKVSMELEVSSNVYKNLLSYLTEINVAESIAFNNYQIIEPAKPSQRVLFPNKKLNMVLAIILGSLWALVVGFFVEYTDDTLRSHEDLKQFQNINILGRIYKDMSFTGDPLLDPLLPSSRRVEIYRKIKNNIYLSTGGNLPSPLMITSSIKGEGKTCLAANLAIVFAMEGRKTLLVDGNLHSPRIGELFKVTEEKGFSQVLAGENGLDAILSSGVSHLDLLPCGPLPPDPSGLIETAELSVIMADLKKEYELIILDCPSIMTVCDPMVMNRTLAAHFLLVVEPGKVTYKMLAESLSILERSNTKLLGVIASKVRSAEGGSGRDYFDDILEEGLLWPVRKLKKLLY